MQQIRDRWCLHLYVEATAEYRQTTGMSEERIRREIIENR